MKSQKSIKAIIIDDESKCRSVLEKQLEWNCPNVNVISSMANPKKAIDAVNQLQPDLIFLDIEMPEMNGFEFLQQFDSIGFDVIFTTAYDEYALRAFQIYAAAYLLKPIDEEQLQSAVTQVTDRKPTPLNQETISLLFESMKHSGKTKKVAIPTSEGLEFIDREKIIRCQSSGNYTRIFIEQRQELLVSKTLKIIEDLLDDPLVFIRSHAAHLVNLNYVAKYLKGSGGQLVMDDGSVIPVSKSKKENIINSL